MSDFEKYVLNTYTLKQKSLKTASNDLKPVTFSKQRLLNTNLAPAYTFWHMPESPGRGGVGGRGGGSGGSGGGTPPD